MNLNKAKNILADNGIFWTNYFDLIFVEKSRDNWAGCEDIYNAIQIIKEKLMGR